MDVMWYSVNFLHCTLSVTLLHCAIVNGKNKENGCNVACGQAFCEDAITPTRLGRQRNCIFCLHCPITMVIVPVMILMTMGDMLMMMMAMMMMMMSIPQNIVHSPLCAYPKGRRYYHMPKL